MAERRLGVDHSVSSENWICMKMRCFATATRRSRQWVLNTQRVLDPFRFVLIAVSGSMNQGHHPVQCSN
jgi:hypothetical protein